jgi:hypothetical protein
VPCGGFDLGRAEIHKAPRRFLNGVRLLFFHQITLSQTDRSGNRQDAVERLGAEHESGGRRKPMRQIISPYLY